MEVVVPDRVKQPIRGTCLTGTAHETIERTRALERAGLQEVIFTVGNETTSRLTGAWSRTVIPWVRSSPSNCQTRIGSPRPGIWL
jgi:hypothetical protein